MARPAAMPAPAAAPARGMEYHRRPCFSIKIRFTRSRAIISSRSRSRTVMATESAAMNRPITILSVGRLQNRGSSRMERGPLSSQTAYVASPEAYIAKPACFPILAGPSCARPGFPCLSGKACENKRCLRDSGVIHQGPSPAPSPRGSATGAANFVSRPRQALPQTARSDCALPITSRIVAAGTLQQNSTRRARQSMLLIWSANTTPATFSPLGKGVSKG